MEIQLPQIIFQIINFSVVVGALTYLLYKPIIKILEERATKIAKAEEAAAKSLSEADKIEVTKKVAKKDAEKQAQQIIEEAKITAKKQAEQIRIDAKSEGKDIIEKMKKDWQQEQNKQLKMMREEFSKAVITVSEKVMNETLNQKKHLELIDQELDSIFKSI